MLGLASESVENDMKRELVRLSSPASPQNLASGSVESHKYSA
jgi:hypothetical protein